MMTKRRVIIWTIILTWLGLGLGIVDCCRLAVVFECWVLGFFQTKLMMQIGLWLLFFGMSFTYIFWQIGLAARSERFKAIYIEDHFEIELSEEGWAAVFKGIRYGLSLLPAISFGNFASEQWLYGLAVLDPVDFDKSDSIFSLDFSFYVFQLPMIDFTSELGSVLGFHHPSHHNGPAFGERYLVSVVGMKRDSRMSPARHLRTQGAFFFVLIGIDWILQRYDVLFSQGQGLVWGLAMDLNARLPSYWIMAVVAIGVAIWLWRSRKHGLGWIRRNLQFLPILFCVVSVYGSETK